MVVRPTSIQIHATHINSSYPIYYIVHQVDSISYRIGDRRCRSRWSLSPTFARLYRNAVAAAGADDNIRIGKDVQQHGKTRLKHAKRNSTQLD